MVAWSGGVSSEGVLWLSHYEHIAELARETDTALVGLCVSFVRVSESGERGALPVLVHMYTRSMGEPGRPLCQSQIHTHYL